MTMARRLLSLALSLLMLVTCFSAALPTTASAEETVQEAAESSDTSSADTEEESNLNTNTGNTTEYTYEEVTLYALDESYAEYTEIPDGFMQSYSLSGNSWEVISGDSVEIDSDGLVTPAGATWYYHQDSSGWWIGQSTPSGADDEVSYFNYNFGDTEILVDNTIYLTVHVVDYATTYAKNVMDTYLEENVNESMTEYEIAVLCCEFVASYDYSTEASGYTGMILTGGGDCWASTSVLLYMLGKVGITCSSRDASADYGAGSQHVNVIAVLDGSYYILEAGYTGTAPRDYTITQLESSSIFTYSVKSNSTVYITGLVLDDEDITEITVPEEIDGYTVTGIANGAFSYNHNFVSVYLPDTVTYIGDKAFYYNDALEEIHLSSNLQTIGENCFTWCKSLKSIDIPATVTSIEGSNPFCYCYALTEINVDGANETYCSEDGVLFDEDMTSLLVFPRGKSSSSTDYTVPDGVEIITAWSFADVSVRNIILPGSVTEIQKYAFYLGHIYSIELPFGIDTISSYSFESCDIGNIVIPDSVETIESYAFLDGNIDNITLSQNLKTIGDGAFAGVINLEVKLPSSVKEIGIYAFWLWYGWSSLDATSSDSSSTSMYNPIFFDEDFEPDSIGEGAFDYNVVLCVYENSYMHQYALDNDLPYYLVEEDGTIELREEWIYGSRFTLNHVVLCDEWDLRSANLDNYTEEELSEIEQTILWNTSDGTCPFSISSRSYEIESTAGENIGSFTVTITGVGLFSGEITIKVYSCGENLNWELDSAGKLTISGTGSIDSLSSPSKSPWYSAAEDITSVVIEDGVTSIGDYTFYYCSNLETVTIPVSVTEIGFCVFYGYSSITDVYYGGTEAQWNDIAIDTGNYTLTSATIHYAVADDNTDTDSEGDSDTNTDTDTDTKTTILMGDVNGDGTVNSVDALLTLRYSAGLTTLDPEQIFASDVNGDSKVNSVDALAMLRCSAGLSADGSCGKSVEYAA